MADCTDCGWWDGWSWLFIIVFFFLLLLIIFMPWQYYSRAYDCVDTLPPERHSKRPMYVVVEDDGI